MKPFQACRNSELQEPGWLTALDQEAMSKVLGQKNEGSGTSVPATFPADEGQFTFEDIEGLVFSRMQVQWRREAGRQDLFDETERLTVALPGRFEKHECVEKPVGLTFLACEDVGFITWRDGDF